MSLNIFEIWERIGRQTPFAVRRDHWSDDYYAIVEKVECKKLPYGKAFGYPTIKGEYSDRFEYDKKWLDEKLIPCCGCYQWTLAENVDVNERKVIVENAVKKAEVVARSFDSKLDFGKYKGITVAAVFQENPGYVLWALVNIDKFYLSEGAILHLEKTNPNSMFNEAIQQANEYKLLQIKKRTL